MIGSAPSPWLLAQDRASTVIVQADQTPLTMGGDLRRILRERRAGDVLRISGAGPSGSFTVDVRLMEREIGG